MDIFSNIGSSGSYNLSDKETCTTVCVSLKIVSLLSHLIHGSGLMYTTNILKCDTYYLQNLIR